MLSHDQMTFAINKLHPDLKYGLDFWTAHPVKSGSDKQLAEAKIIAWQPEDIPPPSIEVLRKIFAKHQPRAHAMQHISKAHIALQAVLAQSAQRQPRAGMEGGQGQKI